MKVIETNGSDLGETGSPVTCAACLEEFDDRGGVLFDLRPGRGVTGICADCTNQVLQAAGAEIHETGKDG